MIQRTTTISRLLGSRKIPAFGAIALIYNAATGPGIPFTPSFFTNPGYLVATFMFLFFTVISGFSALLIVEALQAIPGNSHFQGDVEFATLINFYFDPVYHVIGQAFLYGSLQSNAIQGIVLSAQATDYLLADISGRTCGLTMGFKWICVQSANSNNSPSPFGSEWMLFTLGLIVVLCICLPLGFMNLDDNMW